MSAAQNSEDMEDFPSMGEALAEVNPDLVFREAQRQFAVLTAEQQGESVDLMGHYRDLFHQATSGWDDTKKLKLLKICLAYKTKARVLEFLDPISDTAAWVQHFEHLVKNHGVDSAFDGSEEHILPSTSSSSEVCHPGAAPSLPHPYFVIPTLALAFPMEFFGALVTMAPLDCLSSVPSLYKYPAAPLLAVDPTVKRRIREELYKFLHHNVVTSATTHDHPAIGPWADFFKHLLEGNELLWPAPSRKFGPRLLMESFVRAGLGNGFEEVDLEMWLAAWKADRQKGRKRKAKPRGEAKAKAKAKKSLDKHKLVKGDLVGECAEVKKRAKAHKRRPLGKNEKRAEIKVDWERGRPRKKKVYEERYIWFGPWTSERAASPSGSEISEDEEMEDREA